MRRATTPTHIFTLPESISISEATEAQIIYSQNGASILEKNMKDITVDGENNTFELSLSEEETNLFAPGKALIQVRLKIEDAVLASQMIFLNVKPVLNSEVL